MEKRYSFAQVIIREYLVLHGSYVNFGEPLIKDFSKVSTAFVETDVERLYLQQRLMKQQLILYCIEFRIRCQ